MSVWQDSDHSWNQTELAPNHLPSWESLTELMKMFVAFDLGMEFQECYTFSAHIDPGLVASWVGGSHGLMANVRQRLSRALKQADMKEAAFCYVVETRTRSGRSTTRPHLHGFVIAVDPVLATKFKVTLERALHPSLKRLGRSRAVFMKRGHDNGVEFMRRGTWVSYMAKNAQRWDERLGKRRVYFSRTFTDLARLAWASRRGEL